MTYYTGTIHIRVYNVHCTCGDTVTHFILCDNDTYSWYVWKEYTQYFCSTDVKGQSQMDFDPVGNAET